MSAPQNLVVLGATGTVGRNTLDLVRRHPQRLRALALTAHRDVAGMLALCREFAPPYVAMADAGAAAQLREAIQAQALRIEVLAGDEAVAQLAAHPDADQVMSAIVGSVGLLPTLAAARAGKRVLIANKEPLVMAGRLLMAEAQRCGATIMPIDSEHNAIFQCLPEGSRCGQTPRHVSRLILTASGGPFRELPLAQFAAITPAQAVRHPNWVMGPKISVDSATMMNKGLELIEAAVLYGLPDAQLEVVIHPESAIHSIVEYCDGSMLAQLGQPDMRVPIAHALAWPQRWESGVGALDLLQLGRFRFESVDMQRFPCLKLARAAGSAGGDAPIVLNAANEIAVQAFLEGRLGYLGIAPVIERSLSAAAGRTDAAANTLDEVLAVDAWARRYAQEQL
ncbi:1-deoxy-D-xylulose 5-phosphate reductoisomerase [Solimonas aquatica]|uniref:1-deoxy-D-xylulose 5-phosphate reductoisomerase n=1 Tax=Solimonas aquatica TaxID=489703 RepID=A0A1H9AKH4_9GAMM|nr:1-deoxy-D-xylulose-5-phosphate reductoisomerase [Solimonas aquatica]SEP77011.1 1-deoxy-D-xylulose 5-phosphate reductoisomerase [Solimonas aquatica]